MSTVQNHFRLNAGIFFISMGTLLLELSLTRVMSVSLWYHFGFLVISTALLGFGTAGVILALWKKLRDQYALNKTLSILSLLFGIVTILSFWVLQQIPFDPFSLAVDKRQLYFLPLYYLVVSAPFFISGLVISLLFTRVPYNMSRLYASDLVGAALGCLLVVITMPLLGGSGSVVAAAALGTVAALFFAEKKPLKFTAVLLILAFTGLSLVADKYLPITINTTKRPPNSPITKAKPIFTAWNTFSYIELYNNKEDTIKKIEGERRFIFDAGTAATGMVNLSGGVQRYLEEHPQDSLYWTHTALMHTQNPSVLIIGSGGGQQVLDALHAKAKKVVCIEINPIINKVVKYKMNDYWGGLFHQPGVELITEEGRSFTNRTKEKFDAILSAHTISNAAIASGALSLAENYVLTKEAFREYYDHLTENGILYLSRPEFQLPRVFTTMQEVLAERNLTDSRNYFYAYRQPPASMRFSRARQTFYSVFLFKKSAFTKEEIARIDAFIKNKRVLADSIPLSLEVLYSPLSPDPQNIFDTLVAAKDRKALYKSYPFELTPATDDRPFFNQRVRWTSIGIKHFKDVFSQQSNARLALEDQPIAEISLLMILLQSVVLAAILILLPLIGYGRQGLKFSDRWKYLTYFACLGLGFIMIEIAFIQRFTLYLGQPVYTLAVIIAGLLLFTGLGSYLTDKLHISTTHLKTRYLPLLLAVLIATSLLMPLVFSATIHWNLVARIAVSLIILAPLGALLGMPFPAGIKAVSAESNAFIPWAWGVNGFFTVMGSIGALILGMAIGFKLVILLATLCYLLALFIVPRK